MSDFQCLSCGVSAYSLTSNPPPKLYVCGGCAKTLSKDEIVALAEAVDSSPSHEGPKSKVAP